MRRPLVISLVASVVVALGAFAAVLASGWTPKLGLDLAGGSEVILAPQTHQVLSSANMSTTVNIIRNRVDGMGVSGSSVDSQGGNVVVQLPNVKDPQAVINKIGQTAQLYFRPVLCAAGPYTKPAKGAKAPGPLPSSCSSPQYSLQAPNLTVTPSSNAPNGYSSNLSSIPPDPALSSYPSSSPLTDPSSYKNHAVLLPVSGTHGSTRYLLGPAEMTGTAIASASAQFVNGQWVVDAKTTGAGAALWDKVAKQNFHEMIGMDLDGQVVSAPLTQPSQAAFSSFGGNIEISGSFTQSSAQTLALDLNYGALPVPLKPINEVTVQATLGKSSLKAGLAAGIGGLILVLLYTIVYYRALGVVVVSGLALTGALLWAIISALGHSQGLTLDLAGVTGLIVSIGITVDSYIVYFERLKDDARSGRSVRTSVTHSFHGAFRTVLAADLVSLFAAAILYWLTVGSVKGFALFLGLSTILDLATTFFFTRPLVTLLGRSRTVTDARFIGIARGLAMDSGSQP